MDSLVGYGSDDENETERFEDRQATVAPTSGGSRRKDDDTNYDDVNMDLSEDSGAESEPELPPADHNVARRDSRDDRKRAAESRPDFHEEDRRREDGERRRDERRRDDRHQARVDRERRPAEGAARRPLERPERSQDARDAVSPRFVDRNRRERERDRERYNRRPDDSRRSRERPRPRSRSRSRHERDARARAAPSEHSERRSPPSENYRPTSYKVNKKLEVMEKMGLSIKTPDGSMATAQQLRQAAGEGLPPAATAARALDQVQKRKLLWAHKGKSEAEEAAKWSGTKFAQDSDGRQVSKFMRLMGIKEPGAVQQEPTDKSADPVKKQEELFQAMQAQYEVARATTHTMRGVGLGFQRGQF